MEELADEIRETIIATVASTGGHLGSSLGVVELTIALHRLLESPRDRIVWDTGHQAYPHKLLTGRFERFGTLRQIGGVGGFPRRSESEHDVFDGGHAGTGLSIGQGLAHGARPPSRARADRGRRRRRGDHERPQPRGAQRHRPAEDAAADRPERQRDVDQPDGRRALLVPEPRSSCPARGRRASTKYDSLVGQIPVVGPTRPRARPAAPPLGRELRPGGPAVRGPRNHLHRPRPGTRPQGAALDVQPGAGAARAGHRPRPDAEGTRLPAGRGRPDRLPRRGAAADAAAGRRERHRPRHDADRVDDRRRGPAVGRCQAQGQEPELHRGLRRGADRARAGRTCGSSGSPPACRPGRASRSSRPSSRSDSSTSGSRSSTRWRSRRAWRWAGCVRSSRSTRRSSSGHSTRPSTTSARTISRCCSRSTGPGSSARTGRATRGCSRCRRSASCRTS